MPSVFVPARFNGPPASGQGGYSAGELAAHLDGRASVSLRRPVPLDIELEVRVEQDAARAFADDELVVEAVAALPLATWDAPAVSVEQARAAAARFTPPAEGTFDHCFVCGRARPEDGFAIFGIDLELAFLARQQSELLAPIHAGVEYVAVGRPLGRDRRKGFAATAIVDPDGTVLAHSEQLLIQPRQGMSHK